MKFIICRLCFLRPWQGADWAGWALPMSAEGNLLHVALYCRDVLKFAEAFLDRTQIGVQRVAPRSLDALAQGEEGALSVEDGNRRILGQSFFLRGFATVREMQEATGVQYAVTSGQTLRNEDLAMLHRLDRGTLQFFNYGAVPGPGARSVWVTAEGGGWFYVLTYKEAQVAQSRYVTPTWVLLAGAKACLTLLNNNPTADIL